MQLLDFDVVNKGCDINCSDFDSGLCVSVDNC